MPATKRNAFLDDGDDESDINDSQDDDLDRGRNELTSRATKRRKVQFRDEVSEDDPLDDNHDDEDAVPTDAPGEDLDEDEDADEPALRTTSKLPTPKSVARAEKAARKSGVVYISRVPPFMKPHVLMHFLEPHAPKGLGRIFLTPEDHSKYLSRKKSGGNKKKMFTDGWVEFKSKTEARNAAEMLNGNIMGGKKRGYYHDDIWNIKYLSGFKWSHLTEQISAENAERETRLREEIRKTKQENKAFLQDFERGKMLETMESKSKARGDGKKVYRDAPRDFKQAKTRLTDERAQNVKDANVQRTLDMIF